MSRRAVSIERYCDASLGFVAGAALFAMMILTFVDVVGRYAFSSPLRGGMELIEVLLVLTIFAGLPLTAQHQEHIEIDVLAERFPGWLWSALGRVGNLAFTAGLAFAAQLLVQRAHQLQHDGEATVMLQIPLTAVAWLMAVLTLVSALLHLWRALVPRPAADTGGPAPAAHESSDL